MMFYNLAAAIDIWSTYIQVGIMAISIGYSGLIIFKNMVFLYTSIVDEIHNTKCIYEIQTQFLYTRMYWFFKTVIGFICAKS